MESNSSEESNLPAHGVVEYATSIPPPRKRTYSEASLDRKAAKESSAAAGAEMPYRNDSSPDSDTDASSEASTAPSSQQEFELDSHQPVVKRMRERAPSMYDDVLEDGCEALPEPSMMGIELRFQLARFKGVFRVARVPLNFTFAHLHRYIQFLFGWSGYHAHMFEVYGAVVMYSKNNKPGEIKKCGRPRPPSSSWWKGCKETDEELEEGLWMFRPRCDQPEFEVLPSRHVKKPKEAPITVSDFFPYDKVERTRGEKTVRLDDVWHPKKKRNATLGECRNEEIAIKYKYDLGSTWDVHITVTDEDPFYHFQRERHYPELMKAKGAPPLEDEPGEWDMTSDEDPKTKAIDAGLFAPSSFAKYLAGELNTVARKRKLAVFNVKEEAIRQAERQKRKMAERKARERMLRKWNRKNERHEAAIARGEEVSDLEDCPFDEDDYSEDGGWMDSDSEGA